VDLNVIWFFLVGALFAGYAILDGFDLGVGALHLLHRTDEERRLSINAIGPVWDGNEVWLVTGGGALFAAFPEVYATVFSGFYIAFFLFLAALIFRAVAIEFRSKLPMQWWRNMWDVNFSLGSLSAALLLGVALGNIAWGIPLDERGVFAGTFLGLLHPYALLTGVTTVALFVMHGSIYLHLKTESELQERVRSWIRPSMIFFAVTFVALTMATLIWVPRSSVAVRERPLLAVVLVLAVLAIANIAREVLRGRSGTAFVSSCVTVVLVMALFGLTTFPELVHSNPLSENSLNAYNASSSQKTLGIMLIIAVMGMPLVVAYTISIYWVFRGKVKLTETSY
jgi:cytochrome d ubiquinol oxidase subunit II